jgi:hypothetical protein
VTRDDVERVGRMLDMGTSVEDSTMREVVRWALEERERCAKKAEAVGARWLGRGSVAFAEVAAAIRAGGAP